MRRRGLLGILDELGWGTFTCTTAAIAGGVPDYVVWISGLSSSPLSEPARSRKFDGIVRMHMKFNEQGESG